MPKKGNPYNLTDQQLLFAQLYDKGGRTNAYEAALGAGYSKNYAKKQMHKLLVIVGQYLNELAEASKKEYTVEKARLIRFLEGTLELDPLDLFGVEYETGEEGEDKVFLLQLKDLREIPKEIRKLIAGIKPTRNGYEVKMYDKQKTTEILARLLGYNAAEKHEHTGKDGKELITTVIVEAPE